MKINSSQEQIFGNTRTIFTGITNAKVVAINPTTEEAVKAKLIKEDAAIKPYVDKDDAEVPRVRLDYYLKAYAPNDKPGTPTIDVKLTFFLTNKPYVSKSGKTQVINAFGTTCWLNLDESIPLDEAVASDLAEKNYTWFVNSKTRIAIPGEETLIKFYRAWGNVPIKEELMLENPENLFKGDFKELRQGIKNEIKVLLTHSNGYQAVYNRFFEPPYVKTINGFKREMDALVKANQKLPDFQHDFLLQPYPEKTTIEGAAPNPTNMPEVPSGMSASSGGFPTAGSSEDDLPF